jgi:hypothetical protein
MISDLEAQSINSMSFLPTNDELDQLIKHSTRLPKERGPLLSKLHFVNPAAGLLPESLDPNDTILAKLGKRFGKLGNSAVMTIIDDRNMPLGGGSCGPNGVLTECQAPPYGPDRINLFYKSRSQTTQLLLDYISLRTENSGAIFEMYVKKLVAHRDANYQIVIKEEATLDPKYHTHYSKTCDMFLKLLESRSLKSLEDCGIACNSFCQTWLRNGSAIGNAQFSVMSPHFQTRFFVENVEKVKACGVTEDMIKSYAVMINMFTESMQKQYGVNGGGQAFINMDKMIYALKSDTVKGLQKGPIEITVC